MEEGELNSREEFLKDSIKQSQEKLRLLSQLRSLTTEVPEFRVDIYRVSEETGRGFSLNEFCSYGNSVVTEIFKPLIEQGLAEYRRRLEAQLD